MIRHSQLPWINTEFIRQTKLRDRLFTIAKASKNTLQLCEAKKMRNCNALANKLKREYFYNQFLLFKKNPKKMWNILMDFLPSS